MRWWRPAARAVLALLVVLSVGSALGPVDLALGSAEAGAACAAMGREPAPGEVAAHPFWQTVYFFDTLRPNSLTSDGQSLFFLDHAAPALVQMPLGEKTLQTCELPTPDDWGSKPGEWPRKHSVIQLGPRAFYIVSTADKANDLDERPTLYRSDRFPRAIRGGWRVLREKLNGPAIYGLHAVVQNTTLFMLRSGPGYWVDWQPIQSTTAESIVPSGRKIPLARDDRGRPAAGVVVAEGHIYVFGGTETPNEVIRIPLRRGAPGTPEGLSQLPHTRVGSQALLHGRAIYLVGGNQPGEPTIERALAPAPGSPGVLTWERVPEPPPEGGAVIAAAFARGKLWIVRADGRVQTADLAELQPGRGVFTWDRTIKRSRVVREGDVLDLDLPWSYTGPVDLQNIAVDAKASATYPCVPSLPSSRDRRSRICGLEPNPPFATITTPIPSRTSSPTTPLSAPVAGPPVGLRVAIPREDPDNDLLDVRNEYVVHLTLRSKSDSCTPTGARTCQQRHGNVLTLRFVVDRRPTP
ncbi:MAG TPA: hypothetical protein VG370_18435 [Chloroflexota bacterium]|jgi:hypothetical protein|nr:hypothetical protein [Chloroflexota bacterium]